MAEAKKLVPKRRFKEFQNAEAWKLREFGELADYKKGPFGSALKKDIFVPKSADVVKVYEQQNAIKKDSELERYFITKAYADKLSGFEVYPGDIIVSCAGTIGEMYVLPRSAKVGIINQALMRVRVNEKIVDKTLFKYLFTNMIDSFSQTHSNGSAIKNIPPFADLKPMKVRLPLIDEQYKIVRLLSILDNLITLHQRKLDKIKSTKKAYLSEMFPAEGESKPKRRFKGFSGDWEHRKVTDLLKNSSTAMKIGPFGSALKKEFYVDKGIKVYAQENIFTSDFTKGDYYISEEKYIELKSCELFPGDLVISMMGTIGACAIFPDSAKKGIMNSHLLKVQFASNIKSEYIMFLLRDSDLIRKQIDKLSVGSIMSGLSSSVVKKLVFPIPKIEEQEKLVEYMTSIDNLITLHQQKLNKLKNLKKSYLNEMFI